ncbi:Uncharacterised protein [Vibrio cholerae]|nr:Uncharacterised protein [Vibrio cholerae]
MVGYIGRGITFFIPRASLIFQCPGFGIVCQFHHHNFCVRPKHFGINVSVGLAVGFYRFDIHLSAISINRMTAHFGIRQ